MATELQKHMAADVSEVGGKLDRMVEAYDLTALNLRKRDGAWTIDAVGGAGAWIGTGATCGGALADLFSKLGAADSRQTANPSIRAPNFDAPS